MEGTPLKKTVIRIKAIKNNLLIELNINFKDFLNREENNTFNKIIEDIKTVHDIVKDGKYLLNVQIYISENIPPASFAICNGKIDMELGTPVNGNDKLLTGIYEIVCSNLSVSIDPAEFANN